MAKRNVSVAPLSLVLCLCVLFLPLEVMAQESADCLQGSAEGLEKGDAKNGEALELEAL